jgi:hypothetical protein
MEMLLETVRQYEQRLNRILKSVALEKPDRVPVVLEYSGFAAHVTNTPMAEFLRSPTTNLNIMIRAFEMVGDADAINYGSFSPYNLCFDYLSKVSVPGVDLAEDDMWQVVETELMMREDYERLLQMGWPEYFRNFMQERILNDVPVEYLPSHRQSLDVKSKWKDTNIPVLTGGDVTTPFELLCGSRSLTEFYLDLIEIPDKVLAAMDAMVPHLAAKSIHHATRHGYPTVWVGGWQTAPCMLSPEMWRRFVWPYFKQLVCEVVDAGLIALLHLDSDWTREIDCFKELPERQCIMALDGETDIFRAKEVLANHMCIMGDVSAAMLYLETPETVYDYCKRLINELGPNGFILQSGCDIPTNAKLENVKAMVAAALDS